MTVSEFIERILLHFGFKPTEDQRNALQCFGQFLATKQDMPLMILRGSAGTGKTSLLAAMVKTFVELRQKVVLLAPTGRAAKVLSINSQLPAATIHRKIYRQKAFMQDFNLNDNLHSNTLFVVDEASMISSLPGNDAVFGSGSLLDDIMKYVYSGQNCRMIFVGDTAQLPPVGESESPALMKEMLYGYGVSIFECDLNQVLRQSSESGILTNANYIRQLIQHEMPTSLPKVRFNGFADIHNLPGNELVDTLVSSYDHVGMEETIVVTRSNKNAVIYNNGIRNQVLDRDELLCSGDHIMIVKNKYLDAKKKTAQVGEGDVQMEPDFLANGDRAVVRRVSNVRELYGFTFADVVLVLPDYDDYEIEQTVLLDTLQSNSPSLTREESERLFAAIEEDYEYMPLKADRMKAIREDRYYNALQVKYAYAVTCHKAQGGQWEHVYVDQGYMTDDMLTPDYIHWLYTAMTRASSQLYLVNWPKEQTSSQY